MVKSALRIVLIGSTGAGKSVSGNKILGKRAFATEKGSESVTKQCQEASATIDGKNISVFDTPDFFRMSDEISGEEIKRCKAYVAEGPCAILRVVSLDGRIEESLAKTKKYEGFFGEESFGNELILFTCEDQCGSDMKKWMGQCPSLSTTLEQYRDRYHVMYNFAKCDNGEQIKGLLSKIESAMAIRPDNSMAMKETKMTNTKQEDSLLPERRILLLGRTGVGKSATGNTILRREAFESVHALSSVTRQCQKESAVVAEWNVTVVDTPDYFYITDAAENQDVHSEMERGLSLCTPGAHALLLLFVVGTFTEQENDVVGVFERCFGIAATPYTIVVFTHGDELCGAEMEKLIEKNENVRDLLSRCRGRYHVVNNEEKNDLSQVTKLLELVDGMVSENGGSLYTVDMFHTAKAEHDAEWERMLMEIELEKLSQKPQQEEKKVVEQTEIKREASTSKSMWKLCKTSCGFLGGIIRIVGRKVGIIAWPVFGILFFFWLSNVILNRKGDKGTN